MGFSSSQGGRHTVFGEIVWGSKNTQLPTPNIRLSDNTYVLPEGATGQVSANGKISKFSVRKRASYQEWEQGAKTKSEWWATVTLDDGEIPHALSFRFADEMKEQTFGNSMALLASLRSYARMIQRGEADPDAHVQLGLYSKRDTKDSSKVYSNSIIRLPTGKDENGNYVFGDPKHFVKTEPEDRCPAPEIAKDANGNEMRFKGELVYDHKKAFEWLDGCITELEQTFQRKEVSSDQEATSQDGDDSVDLSEVADAVNTTRPRMTS